MTADAAEVNGAPRWCGVNEQGSPRVRVAAKIWAIKLFISPPGLITTVKRVPVVPRCSQVRQELPLEIDTR